MAAGILLMAQTPVPQVPRTPPVDPAAHDRGRALWASHASTATGRRRAAPRPGPNIIRTKTVNFDRTSFTPGSVLGPFLKAGHPTQSGKPSASFTDEEIVGLAHFLRQRVNDTMRGSPLFTVGDILVGDAKAGEAYFNGAGGCATCHNATTRSLAGIRARVAIDRRSAAADAVPVRAAWPRRAGRRPIPTPSRSPSRRRPGRRCPACSSSRAIST